MMKNLTVILFFLFIFKGYSQLPSTDIIVGDVIHKSNEYLVLNLKNITSRTGYDNQPCFSEDGNLIYFSSDRDGPQTDVYKFEIRRRNTERITQTPESEYSPTPLPFTDALSVVRVGRDSAQQLYRMLPDGSNPVILYKGKDTVGYFSWVDAERILIFALGDPNTIRLINLSDQESVIIAENAGRRLHRVPGENSVSFTVKTNSDVWQIRKFSSNLNKVDIITDLPHGMDDYAWLNSSTIVSGNNGKLFFFNSGEKEKGWQLMADISKTPAADFYRIAFDPSGKKIALVIRNQAAE